MIRKKKNKPVKRVETNQSVKFRGYYFMQGGKVWPLSVQDVKKLGLKDPATDNSDDVVIAGPPPDKFDIIVLPEKFAVFAEAVMHEVALYNQARRDAAAADRRARQHGQQSRSSPRSPTSRQQIESSTDMISRRKNANLKRSASK